MKIRKLLNLLRNSKNLFRNLWNENAQRPIIIENSAWEIKKKDKDKRIEKRPVDIYEQIISEEPKINLNNLDGQIKLVEERIKVLKQHLRNINLGHEETAISFLKARKKYLKYKDEFKWEITNKDLIDKLCEKYKVKMVSIENFYRNIPKEGVDEIKKFGEALENVSNNDPLFKLIIDDKGKETKKDPILLAQSPFGNWFYILGAWDKEIAVVDKLIYGGQ